MIKISDIRLSQLIAGMPDLTPRSEHGRLKIPIPESAHLQLNRLTCSYLELAAEALALGLFPQKHQRVPHALVRISRGDVIDRKSTRLNSSHLGISYAVFCLKKKK